jgi:DNA primase
MTAAQKLPQRWLAELIDRTDIAEVIGRYVKLARAGKEFRACCPFHSDRTPSFTVNVEKRFFHCFGCGRHGNVIDFLTQHLGLGFREAVGDLAHRAGMRLPLTPRSEQDRRRDREVIRACQRFHGFCQSQLAGQLNLLQTLGIEETLAGRFQLGFAPARYSMPPESTAVMREAGLVTDDGAPRILDRLVLPISTTGGGLIGLVAFEVHDRMTEPPIVCGLPSAYEQLIQDPAQPRGRSGELFIVPSAVDLLRLNAIGLRAVAIPSRYPLSVHFLRLSHLSDTIVLFLPSGPKGDWLTVLAAHEYANIFNEDIASARVSFFSPDRSLSCVARQLGADRFRATVRDADPLLDRALAVLPRRLNKEDPHDRRRYVDHLLRFAAAPSRAVAVVTCHTLAQAWGIPATAANRALRCSGLDLERNEDYGPGTSPALRLLTALLHDPSCVRYVADIPHSEDPYVSLVQGLIAHLRGAPADSMPDVLDFIEHHPNRALLMQLTARRRSISTEPVVEVVESMHGLASQPNCPALPRHSAVGVPVVPRADPTR